MVVIKQSMYKMYSYINSTHPTFAINTIQLVYITVYVIGVLVQFEPTLN